MKQKIINIPYEVNEIPFPNEFYNTIKVEGEELEKRTSDAKFERYEVMEFFKKFPDGKFTPFEVWEALGYSKLNTPVSSIRRAMTNLTTKTDSGFLIKLKEKKPERLGAPNFLWKLNHNFLPF